MAGAQGGRPEGQVFGTAAVGDAHLRRLRRLRGRRAAALPELRRSLRRPVLAVPSVGDKTGAGRVAWAARRTPARRAHGLPAQPSARLVRLCCRCAQPRAAPQDCRSPIIEVIREIAGTPGRPPPAQRVAPLPAAHPRPPRSIGRLRAPGGSAEHASARHDFAGKGSRSAAWPDVPPLLRGGEPPHPRPTPMGGCLPWMASLRGEVGPPINRGVVRPVVAAVAPFALAGRDSSACRAARNGTPPAEKKMRAAASRSLDPGDPAALGGWRSARRRGQCGAGARPGSPCPV